MSAAFNRTRMMPGRPLTSQSAASRCCFRCSMMNLSSSANFTAALLVASIWFLHASFGKSLRATSEGQHVFSAPRSSHIRSSAASSVCSSSADGASRQASEAKRFILFRRSPRLQSARVRDAGTALSLFEVFQRTIPAHEADVASIAADAIAIPRAAMRAAVVWRVQAVV